MSSSPRHCLPDDGMTSGHPINLLNDVGFVYVSVQFICCATSRNIVGSISDGVTGIFIYIIRLHYGLGSTQHLTEMGTRCVGPTTLPP